MFPSFYDCLLFFSTCSAYHLFSYIFTKKKKKTVKFWLVMMIKFVSFLEGTLAQSSAIQMSSSKTPTKRFYVVHNPPLN